MPQTFDPNDPNAQPDLAYAPPTPPDIANPPPETTVSGISTPVEEATNTPAPAPTGTGPTSFDKDAVERQRLINQQGNVDQAAAAQAGAAADREGKIAGDFATSQDKKISDMDKLAAESNRLRTADNAALLKHATSIEQDPRSQIDPNHWWNSKDTGGKVAAVIGLILGGVAQAGAVFAGNKNAKNPALDELDNIIKDDIDSQQANLKNKWDAYREMHGIVDNAENERHWEMLYKQKEFDLAHTVFDAQLKQAAAQSGSESAKINAQQAIVTHDKAMADEKRAMGIHGEQLAAQGAQLVEKRRQEQIVKDRESAALRDQLKDYAPDEIDRRVRAVNPMDPGLPEVALARAVNGITNTVNPKTGAKFTRTEAVDYAKAHPELFPIAKPATVPSTTGQVEAGAGKVNHEDYVKISKTYDDKLALINSVEGKRLSDQDRKALEAAGLLVGNPIFGNNEFDAFKARAIAKTQKDADLESLRAAPSLTPPAAATPAAGGNTPPPMGGSLPKVGGKGQ